MLLKSATDTSATIYNKNDDILGGIYSNIPVAQDGQPLCPANKQVDYAT